MIASLRSFILGAFTASCAAYFYNPHWIVVVVAFFLGHFAGIAVVWIGNKSWGDTDV